MQSTRFASLGLALALLPAFLAPACGGKDARPAEKTVDGTARLVGEYEALGAQLGNVNTALTGLRSTVEAQGILKRDKVAVGDVGKAYEAFQDSLEELRDSAKDVTAGRSALKGSVDKQLAKWDADIKKFQSTDLKKTTQQRRDSTAARFGTLSAELDGFALRVDGYVGRLAEIETALAHDLTPAGVGALDNVLKDAAAATAPVTEEMTRVIGLVRDYAASLSASGTGG